MIAHYGITSKLGSGGMGEVWRATDTKLNRDVAIKILPEAFAQNPDRLARFAREAQVLASLNHPNIAAIYGVEEHALVMELVPGPTLAERIAQGPVPLDEALPIARQIADALEYAHERGVVHRDLKPANIKIRSDGVVKVLDFGLAKMAETLSSEQNPESSPTMTMEQTGVLIGTAAYMAPEQARGGTVDKRADIWAFGVVLYEMLTSNKMFKAGTVSDTLALVLAKEPDWSAAPSEVHPLLRRCLVKDPKRRLRDIGDAMPLLEDAPAAAPARTRPWLLASALVIALAALAFVSWRSLQPRSDKLKPLVRLDIDLGKDVSTSTVSGADAVLSPDGNRIAFVSQDSGGKPHLSTRALDQSNVIDLPNTEGAYGPFFSPDGQWLGFFAQGKLKKTRIEGGEAITLADAPSGRGASWGEGDNIIAALDTRAGLSLVSAAGGAVAQATEFDRKRGEATHRWPQMLAQGKSILFTNSVVTQDFDAADLAIESLAEKRARIVLNHVGTYARVLASGHLVYMSKGTLFAVPFDLDRLEARGTPVAVLDGISYDPLRGFAQLDISRSGAALYRRGSGTLLRTIQWVDGAGKTEILRAQPANYQFPRLSPDGSRLAVSVVDGVNSDIWVYDSERDLATRLTNGAGVKEFPTWTPDGRHIVFQSEAASALGMYSIPADGGGKPEKLIASQYLQSPGSFSRDGTRLTYGELQPAGMGSDIRVVPIDNRTGALQAGKPEVFLSTPSTNPYPSFSPDGRWIAYCSTESGVYEVYVRAYPDRGSKWQISNSGGMMPVWSATGHEIFYRTDDQRLMAASYTVNGDSFVAAKPRQWYSGPLANLGLTANFDFASDGKRAAVLLPAGNSEPAEARNHVTLLLNFFDELKRRAPVRGK